jgi:hypothetical protein
MTVVDFYKLPRALQDRFVGSVQSGFPPAPLLALKATTPRKFMWLALSAFCFVALVVVTRLGYGNLESGLALHGAKLIPLYLVLAFGLVFGLVAAAAQAIRERALPYASGVYLFPACAIDARSESFKVHATSDLISVQPEGGRIAVAFAGGAKFVFPATGDIGALIAEVNAGRDRAMRARATEDPAELIAADPLHNPRFSSPVGPREPYAMRRPPWGKHGWVIALVAGVALSPALWALRNSGSDKKMYALATRANDTAGYRAYLAHGRKYETEVKDILLPRAELRDAVRAGTVEALLAYKASHPKSRIGPEVASAIRAAMLGELEKAKADGKLQSLEAFATKFPDHGVDAELKAAIHAVYVRELESYKTRCPNKDKTVLPFVERLYAYAEQKGGKIQVRVRRKPSGSLGRADHFVSKTPTFMGEISYPSRYFDEKHAAPREAKLRKELVAKFAELGPLFTIEDGEPVTGETLPPVDVPTIFVTHGAEWSSHSYVSRMPRGSYIGMLFPFDAQFVLPGDDKPFKYKTEPMRHAALGVLKTEKPPGFTGPEEERVYDAMADEAFDIFVKRFSSHFFK